MTLPSLDDLRLLTVVARERSFTRAAALLGLRQSSVSRTIRLLEERVGTGLLARTTRSVSLTEAGERLLREIGPALEMIDARLANFSGPDQGEVGHLRLTTVQHAFNTVLRPALPELLTENPRFSIEVVIDDALTDIVAERFDAGIRFGGFVEKDMIARRVGPDVAAAVVASPAYIAAHGRPAIPEHLTEHRCINYRTARSGGLYRWWFEKGGRTSNVSVEGAVILNEGNAIVSAALDSLGIAYTFRNNVQDHLESGRLVSLLEDWCPAFPGYHIYYASRHRMPPGLSLLVAKLTAKARVSGLG